MKKRTPVQKAIDAAGNASELARRLGIKVQAIQQWKQIPAKRIIAVEAVTGIPRNELRPELYAKAAA